MDTRRVEGETHMNTGVDLRECSWLEFRRFLSTLAKDSRFNDERFPSVNIEMRCVNDSQFPRTLRRGRSLQVKYKEPTVMCATIV